MSVTRGFNFLMTPGPTNIPERILRAMHRPGMEYAGPEFTEFSIACHEDIKALFKTESEVFMYAANGHGAWEAALTNTLSPGDKVLVPETGVFSLTWSQMAKSLGLKSKYLTNDWRHAIDPAEVESHLNDDKDHEIKAVLVVHTDTATGITSDIAAIRKAIDSAGHPALLMVDAIASLICTDFRTDEWGVDVVVAGSQKGLMMPPGMSFTAANTKARQLGESSTLPRSYWDWRTRRGDHHYTWYCGTAPQQGVYGLREAIDMIMEEGLDQAFARHRRLAQMTRAAIEVWAEAGALELNALVDGEKSASVSTILIPEDLDVQQFHTVCRDRFNLSLGNGIGKLTGKAFRIGHMGNVNEPMIIGTIGSVEAGLEICGIPHGKGGAQAAVNALSSELDN